jgi:hypothetical protein
VRREIGAYMPAGSAAVELDSLPAWLQLKFKGQNRAPSFSILTDEFRCVKSSESRSFFIASVPERSDNQVLRLVGCLRANRPH